MAVTSSAAGAQAVAQARAFYARLGRTPSVMRKQLPGHVANRLTSAIFREAVRRYCLNVAATAAAAGALRSQLHDVGLRCDSSGHKN